MHKYIVPDMSILYIVPDIVLWYNIYKGGGQMAISKAQQKAVTKYMKENYDEVKVRMPKGQKEVVKAHADKHDGGSVNAFINRAITNQMERDNSSSTDTAE
nr:MAG TPA: Alginate and motility regulator [Bacteriophage sp.]